MTIVQEVKKIIPSKLDDKAKAVYNRLKEETNNFDIEFLVVYTDLEKAVEQFVEVVKKKYPDAVRVVRKKEKPTPPPTPEPETDDKEVLEVIRDYRISETQAKKLVQLRRDASESKKESIDKMLDTLKKSEFYNARYTSKQNIDKNRTRDIKKDSNRGSLTAKDELNMTGKRYKRISKAGHKNQYGTTEGGKVYYEYRANRRDIDHKIELANGGALKGRFKKHFNKGGMIDLFIDYENIPPKIQEILDFYEEDFQDGNYNGLSKALKEVEANGYTFEFYLDGEAYGLRPKNVPLNKIKGYEEYSKGGKIQSGQIYRVDGKDYLFGSEKQNSEGFYDKWEAYEVVYDTYEDEKHVDYERTKKYNRLKYFPINVKAENVSTQYFNRGGGVGKFKYERGQKFQDQYGEIILLDKYSDGLWEARRWSGMRHVGDVVISEKDLDLIRTKKFAKGNVINGVKVTKEEIDNFVYEQGVSRKEAEETLKRRKARLSNDEYKRLKELNAKVRTNSQTNSEDIEFDQLVHKYRGWQYKKENGGAVEGRFKKHFKKGGNVKATYIPNASIKSLTTKYGSTIKGKDLLDGAYTTRKNVKLEPKVDRFMFEEEMYEYGKGGWVLYDEDTQEPIRTYKTEAQARKNLYEYEGNGNIVEKSVWDKTYEPKVDRFMFEEEMYEYKKGGRVSEDVYYDMLGAVPPLFISELDGIKQLGNTTFAVGEAYDYMNTPNGFKAVYQAYSQKGKFYYNEGLVYFTERGVAKSIKE